MTTWRAGEGDDESHGVISSGPEEMAESLGPAIRSFFDRVTGTVFADMLVPEAYPKADLLRTLAEAPASLTRSLGLVQIGLELLRSEYESTMVHEFHHFFQLVAFPFQYLQALRELCLVMGLLQSIAGPYRDEVLTLDQIELPSIWEWTLSAPTRGWALSVVDDALRILAPDLDAGAEGVPSPSSISEVALLEESTSVFEFQALRGERGSGEEYRAWLRQGPARYSAVFRWLERRFGTDETYAALPALARASFHTTEPCVTFATLLKEAPARIAPAASIGSDSYYLRVVDLLADLLPTLREGSNYPAPNEPRPAPPSEPLFIRPADVARWITAEPWQMAGAAAAFYYSGLVDGTFETTDLLRPFDPQALSRLWTLTPMMLIIRLRHPGVLPRDAIGVVSPLVASVPWPPDQAGTQAENNSRPVSYRDAAGELQRIRAVGLALARVPLAIGHNCHHTDCPIHRFGACRWWTAIPREWPQCTFPAWFAGATNHVVTTMGDLAPLAFYSGLPPEWPAGWRRFAGLTEYDWLTNHPSHDVTGLGPEWPGPPRSTSG